MSDQYRCTDNTWSGGGGGGGGSIYFFNSKVYHYFKKRYLTGFKSGTIVNKLSYTQVGPETKSADIIFRCRPAEKIPPSAHLSCPHTHTNTQTHTRTNELTAP